MISIDAIKVQRADDPASVMAIGTANPPNCVDQSTFPDIYFKVTNSDHMTELKDKFTRMCVKSDIKTRNLYVTEDILLENPNMCVYKEASLNVRHDIVVKEIPKLGKAAAEKAIEEWGQSKSKITHLIFCSTSGVDAPGADFQLSKLLGLNPYVKRIMLYMQGCHGGAMVLRIAKDLAENNRGARVLAICAEITLQHFHGPSDTGISDLLGQSIFGDGAAALIIGADPVIGAENPLFKIVSAAQTVIPDSDDSICGHLRESGLMGQILKNVPSLVSSNIEKSLLEAFEHLGISDWNTLFWIVHPGGAAILNAVENKLNLQPEKLRSTRQVLSDHGNMSSASVFFVLDETRKNSAKQGLPTTGEGLDWGVLFGFGPGITIETVVLHSVAT